MNIGDKIKKLREENKMTQEELAKYINSTKQTIYKYESNIITNIPSDKIEIIAKALGVSPSYLMGWNDGDYVKIQLDETLANKLQKVIYKYIPKFTDFILDTCNKLSISSEHLTNEYFANKSYELYTKLLKDFSGENYKDWRHECIEETKNYNKSITINIIRNEIYNILSDKINDISNYEFSNIIEGIYNEVHDIVVPDVFKAGFLDYLQNRNQDLTSSIYDIIEKSETVSNLNVELINMIEDELFHDVFANAITDFAKQLNFIGQEKILDYTKDLLANERYSKDTKITSLPKKEEAPEHLKTVAAHNDGELTDEIKDFIDKF